MTITEAKNDWKVSYDQICQWLEKGIIHDVEIVDGIILINAPKPLIPKKGSNITVESIRKYILKACNEMSYIDYRILGIKKEYFSNILAQLETKNYIQRNAQETDYLSNTGFVITEDGISFLKKGKFKLDKLGFELKFQYLNVSAALERSN